MTARGSLSAMTQAQRIAFDNKIHFRADDTRIIRFDPDGSGRSGLIGFIRGTSFAAPAALAHDMLACRISP